MSRVDTEIKAMMMLQHENVAKLEGVMEGEGHVFFIMELCGGGTLSEFMAGKVHLFSVLLTHSHYLNR